MSSLLLTVTKADRVRCRPEDAGNHLLYNPRTDQLHIIDEQGKQIFDLCDGRSIDDVVRDSSRGSATGPSPTSDQVLGFLCALKKRDLVVMR
jgi:hypothetical protein